VDELTRKIQAETDKAKRNAMIKEAFDLHSADMGHLPLHQQALAWGVNKKIKLVQWPTTSCPSSGSPSSQVICLPPRR
jgi:peptide/nickel transport system substrate-binding protein